MAPTADNNRLSDDFFDNDMLETINVKSNSLNSFVFELKYRNDCIDNCFNVGDRCFFQDPNVHPLECWYIVRSCISRCPI